MVGEFERLGVVIRVMVGLVGFTVGFDVGGILGVHVSMDEDG